MENTDDIKMVVGIEVIRSYKRLSYTPWYALAEFVDNSTQAYFNNKEVLDKHFKKKGERLIVDINYDRGQNRITIKDNSIGMSKTDLTSALKIGIPPANDGERSKYGLGLKTAACWFGNIWTIETKKLGETVGYSVVVDVEKVAEGDSHALTTQTFTKDPEEHYTIITITALNRQYRGKTLTKIKDFLTSMYRFDFDDIGLILKWQHRELQWEGFNKRFYITQDGKPYKKEISFEIGNKKIHGWVGVLAKGSRKDAGFSIIQNKRIIKGWPSAYKPDSVFGDQDLGTNDLINQRVVGELYMDGFAVSHTKDSILWQDDEEEQINEQLGEACKDAMLLAQTLRVRAISDDKSEEYRIQAIDKFESELKSSEIKDKLFNQDIPDERAISISNNRIVVSASADAPSLEVNIGDELESINTKLYFRKISEFEPYVTIEPSIEKNSVTVIINLLHPYWEELKSYETILSFVRHCVYDGLAEWRASKRTGRINHDTVKYIKDMLLRLPNDITNNKFGEIFEEEL